MALRPKRSAGAGRRPPVAPELPPAEERDPHFVTALARGLEVLRCFSPTRPALGTSEIGRATGLAQPTVWRLCQTLLALGYLVQHESDRKLRLGLPVLQLGYAVLANEDFGQLARPYMQDIAARYRTGVSLGMRDGSQVLYLQRNIGGSVRFANWTVGSRVPLLQSAIGWACLAALPDQSREDLLQAEMMARKLEAERLIHDFRVALTRFREKGFIIVQGSVSPDASAVAVVVKSDEPERILALSCGGMNDALTPELLDQIGFDLLELAKMLEPAVPAARTTGLHG